MGDFDVAEGYGDIPERQQAVRTSDRFWMKPEQEINVQFCDSQPKRFWEHLFGVNFHTGQRSFSQGFATCIGHQSNGFVDDCPACVGRIRRRYVGMLTIINLTGWEGKDGGKRGQNEKQILAATTDDLRRLERKASQVGSFVKEENGVKVGAVFAVFRTKADKSPRIGDDWSFTGFKPFPEDVDPSPIDYKQFAPFTPEKLQELVEKYGESEQPSAPAQRQTPAVEDDDEEIPF